MIRVAIFEDNRNFREGLFYLIDGTEGYECVGSFANCENLILHLEETKPDVLIMDIEMQGTNGIVGARIAKENFPDIKILMETAFDDGNKVVESICNGADGYILKNTPPVQILQAIKEIYEGVATITPTVASQVLKIFKHRSALENNETHNLTDCEKEILKCIASGMSYKIIAKNLYVSIETISGLIKSICKKLRAFKNPKW